MRGEPPITPNSRSPYDSPTDTLLLVALGLIVVAPLRRRIGGAAPPPPEGPPSPEA